MAGSVFSNYYSGPSLGSKGNSPSKLTYHTSNEVVTQFLIMESVNTILRRLFVDCCCSLMTCYVTRDG
jgi:hypothetical protein